MSDPITQLERAERRADAVYGAAFAALVIRRMESGHEIAPDVLHRQAEAVAALVPRPALGGPPPRPEPTPVPGPGRKR